MTKPINLKIENAVGNITWTSSDPEVAVVDENGKVTAKKFGEVTITATDSSDNTSAEYKIVVKQIAVQPDLPEEKEFVQMIDLIQLVIGRNLLRIFRQLMIRVKLIITISKRLIKTVSQFHQ